MSDCRFGVSPVNYPDPDPGSGTKVCSRGLGHMTKVAATSIYGKNPSKPSSPEPKGQ